MKRLFMKRFTVALLAVLVMGLGAATANAGSALQFDGVSETVGDAYVEIPSSVSLQVQDAITIEAWFRMDDWVTGMQIFGKGDRAYSLRRDSTINRVTFMLRDEDSNIIPTVTGSSTGWGLYSAALDLDTWYHVAATWDGTTARIYIDGVEQNSVATTAGIDTIGTSADPVHIGVNFNRTTTPQVRRYWNGVIDEVRLWNVARTEAEIQAQMGVELSGSEAGLVGYWKLNEGSGTTASDSSGNGNDGTIVNAEWTEGAPDIVPSGAAWDPSPANNAVGVGINPVLSWKAPNTALLIDPDGAFEYIVYFDSNESLVEGGDATVRFGPLDETEWSPPYLSTTTTYYWRVDVVDPNVGGTPVVYPGQVWSFTTGTSVCEYEPLGDLNDNCIVDLADLAILVSNWLVCNLVNGDCP